VCCGGLLAEYSPSSSDRRILDVSVLHLLQHSAGWDHRVTGGDPVFNGDLRSRSSPTTDKPRQRAAASKHNIVVYMMNQTLNHEPGKSLTHRCTRSF